MHKSKLLAILLLALTGAVGCTHRPGPAADVSEPYHGSDGYNSADSLVDVVGDARDFERVLIIVDSLEQAGELSLPKVIFYNSIAYNILGQHRQALQLYYRLGEIDVKELTTKADLNSYIYSYNNYIRLLCDMRRYDRALREVYAADRKLKSIGYDTFADYHDIAQIVGECQLYLGQTDSAAISFQKSLKGVHTRLATFHDPLDFRECQKTMNAIAKAYYFTGHFDLVQPWIEVQDSLFAIADKHPKRDSVFIDEMKADINFSMAMLAQAQGRTADAEQAYNAYQSTQTAQQQANIINSCDYLLATHRYQEAARCYEQLDGFLMGSGYKANVENLGRYMVPKYRANMLAGHRDSAFRVANIIAQYYDTALVRQRAIDADLMTTFYDTEGKERQIAEQRAELSQQRLFTVVIVMVIVVAFFLIYTILRRKAYQKLDATNRQLVIANERAEESSRMKTKFIQQITHEVRTPLNVLSGFAQVLASPDMEVDGKELKSISQKMIDNSDRITHLIDKMLDLSQINSHADIKRNDTVRPAEVARQAITQSGIRQAMHLQFDLQEAPDSESLTITTNRQSAAKALTLLLDNAVKFTHPLAFKGSNPSPNTHHVTLRVSRDDRQVTFAVEDTGIGIPPEQAENIFTEFVQLDEYTDGAGIGLSIARSLARHLGGDIVLDTAYSPGARFVMTLPL